MSFSALVLGLCTLCYSIFRVAITNYDIAVAVRFCDGVRPCTMTDFSFCCTKTLSIWFRVGFLLGSLFHDFVFGQVVTSASLCLNRVFVPMRSFFNAVSAYSLISFFLVHNFPLPLRIHPIYIRRLHRSPRQLSHRNSSILWKFMNSGHIRYYSFCFVALIICDAGMQMKLEKWRLNFVK